jgi:peptidoglycan hydrolase-like protein with peptidoglycan-binding domain
VLGASAYNFAHALNIGSRGADVTQLQVVLIAGGFLVIDAPTGYFGKLTFAAVKAYQKAHGLPQVGNVGPLTRAQLNKGQ